MMGAAHRTRTFNTLELQQALLANFVSIHLLALALYFYSVVGAGFGKREGVYAVQFVFTLAFLVFKGTFVYPTPGPGFIRKALVWIYAFYGIQTALTATLLLLSTNRSSTRFEFFIWTISYLTSYVTYLLTPKLHALGESPPFPDFLTPRPPKDDLRDENLDAIRGGLKGRGEERGGSPGRRV